MPRVTRSASKPFSKEKKPYSKPTEEVKKTTSKSKTTSKTPTSTASSKANPQKAASTPKTNKDAKASHLYTDDNPSTTVKGTGFKDAAKAEETIQLVSKRSPLYQWQTINTMYNRAKHHPHSATSADIQAAMRVFRTWLDDTYPKLKESQTDFPTLKKEVVKVYLPQIRQLGDKDAETWAEMYAELGKGKKMANVLMDETRPDERDMAKVRQDILEDVVKLNGGKVPGKKDEDFLWDGSGGPSELHLKCIAYAFSPCRPDELAEMCA